MLKMVTYTRVEVYSALKKKKKRAAGHVVYSMVLPVVNIKFWGWGAVVRCKLLLFKTPWVELSIRQTGTSW